MDRLRGMRGGDNGEKEGPGALLEERNKNCDPTARQLASVPLPFSIHSHKWQLRGHLPFCVHGLSPKI